MIRKITCLTGLLILLGMALCAAPVMFPQDGTISTYAVTMHYGALEPGDAGTPGIEDFPYRGYAIAEAELQGNFLFVHGSYGYLAGPILPEVANGIHIHHDPALYHLDTIVAGIANEGLDMGTFEDAVYLTPEQQQMLVEGRLYMDIHTTAYPGGEVRGMIVAVPELPLVAAR
ncbi:MAG: CHRD domain-containing protein [Deinococcales bacterium]